MNTDPVLRVMLGLILLCLVLLVAQGFGLGSQAEGPYRISVIKAKPPWLMRLNTVTGQAEQLELRGERRWVMLGEREPEPDETEGGAKELDAPSAAAGQPSPSPALPAGPGDELAALVEAVGPANPREIRIWAAGLLGSYVGQGPDTAVPALIRTLADADDAVVAAAAHSLARSRHPDALAALKKLESHRDAAVQAAAREALATSP